MTDKRAILKQLSHTLERLNCALKAFKNKDVDLAEENVRLSYNLIKQALKDEKNKYRNDDKE